MKQLTYSRVALARLRANKRAYLSLSIGIFLAIFLVAASILTAQGVFLAWVEKTERTVGKLDAFLLDDPDTEDAELMASGLFSELGHVYVLGQVREAAFYLGRYDAAAEAHLYRTMRSGRMPEAAGEIAVEAGALLTLDPERTWALGDTLELPVLPVDGVEEHRRYTLVGILQDQSKYLFGEDAPAIGHARVRAFPAALVSEQEPAFASGRVAVHRTLLAKGGLRKIRSMVQFSSERYGELYYITMTGQVLSGYYPAMQYSSEQFQVALTLGVLLVLSLLISCCVGISGAMEGVLIRRSEEIGVLRAVGATRRQIRRMFGRESLLLALFLAPLSILLSMGAVRLASVWMPDVIVWRRNLWLLLPIAALSTLLVFLAGYLPLRRSSNQMPMRVIRDTAVLRKASHIKSSRQFRVERLISGRMLRLNPGRQVGPMVLCGLMLLSMFCVAYAALPLTAAWEPEPCAFLIYIHNGGYHDYTHFIHGEPLSERSLAQLRALPHVRNIQINRSMVGQVLMPEESAYLRESPLWSETAAAEMPAFLNAEGFLYPMGIQTVLLDRETVAKCQEYLLEGDIDVEAIDAGQEVLIAAPAVWEGVQSNADPYTRYGKRQNASEVLVAENDCFYAGQTLPVYHLYARYEDDLDNAQVSQANVTVGAVLSETIGLSYGSPGAVMLTTERGIQNMGLYVNGLNIYKIYLDGAVDISTEKMLAERIEAIAARSENAQVRNLMEQRRERDGQRQRIFLTFAAITLVFLAVSVSLIVSSNTRRIRSDGRRIGMLRAVGADEKTILRIYTGQVTASILGGFVLAASTILLLTGVNFLYLEKAQIVLPTLAVLALSLLCWAVCRLLLRLRVQEIIRMSIIDNIREL